MTESDAGVHPIHRVASAHAVPGVALVLGVLNVSLAFVASRSAGSLPLMLAFACTGLVLAVLAVLAYLCILPLSDSDLVGSAVGMLGAVAGIGAVASGLTQTGTIPVLLAIVSLGVSTAHARAAGGGAAAIGSSWVLAAIAGVGLSEELASWTLGLMAAIALALIMQHGRRSSLDAIGSALGQHVTDALTDTLTGLHNRRGLLLLGQTLFDVARRNGDAVACTFIDVNGLKQVNDTLGHDAGDRLILDVGGALSECTRATDVVCRWGGDEFVVVSLGTGIPADEMERRLHASLASHGQSPADGRAAPGDGTDSTVGGVGSAASVTAGRAMLEPWAEGDLEGLIQQADHDMYVRRVVRRRALAKKGGAPRGRDGGPARG